MTDSVLVPRGKGEIEPGQGSETEPETGCLQAVGGRPTPDDVPFV